MAIGEGEVLEMIDNSRHDWCLVRRTNFKEPSEGWVKSSFIRDCSKGENRGESPPPLYPTPTLLPWVWTAIGGVGLDGREIAS